MHTTSADDRIAELLQQRMAVRAAIKRCREDGRDMAHGHEATCALSKQLRRIKWLLFYLRHRTDTERQRHAYRRRCVSKLETQLARLSSLPDDQFVNQTRTAGHMKHVLSQKLQRKTFPAQ